MSKVSDACLWALDQHIINHWSWPRENDLVVDIVHKIKSSLNPAFQLGELRELKTPTKSVKSVANTPLVRTEVKLGSNNGERIDVCLLKGNPVIFYGKKYGCRNVVLRIESKDAEELLEVKLDPHTQGGWINDLIKLCRVFKGLEPKIPLHLLAIDNSLEHNEIRIGQPDPCNFAWPLEKEKIIHIHNHELKTKTKTKAFDGFYSMTLEHQRFPIINIEPGIYLWALAVISGKNDPTSLEASCWKLKLTSFSGPYRKPQHEEA